MIDPNVSMLYISWIERTVSQLGSQKCHLEEGTL